MPRPNFSLTRRLFASALVLATVILGVAGFGQPAGSNKGFTLGAPATGEKGVSRTTADIMTKQAASGPKKNTFIKREFVNPGRAHRPQDPNSRFKPQIAPGEAKKDLTASGDIVGPSFSQTIGLQWDGVTGPVETASFPPDTMGMAGPSQFVIFVNGKIRTFNKTTGVADGVLDADPDVFFSSVMTPVSGNQVNFTTDPQVRYDRLTKRWILQMLDLPSSAANSVGDMPNRVMIAVSDAASNGVISNSTTWTYFFIQQNTVGGGDTGELLDYDSLGVDANALYIGGNMFTANCTPTVQNNFCFTGTSAFVVQKSSVLGAGPIVVTAFRGLITGGDGPDSPRGVDNYDPNATEGYIIGVSDSSFGRLIMRRISNPGGTPGISANIPITVDATQLPNDVPAPGTSPSLDALDDRLFAAQIRNGHLWSAHNILVQSNGTADPCPGNTCNPNSRDAARWYDLIVPPNTGTPTVNQSGTIFDPTGFVTQARWYWIPSIVVSGQGHAAIGFSTAGNNFNADAGYAGRLSSDTLGTLSAPNIFTSSNSFYNPADGQNGGPHRWGDYSFTSVDPNDDMTLWTVQEWCDGGNTYGVEVAKLLAPPPAQPMSGGTVAAGQASANVNITGTSSSGSGFFDPGAGFPNRISASVTGNVTVNSVTYTDPTHLTLNVNTTSAANGAQDVTITNPDGQSATGNGILIITGGASPTPTATATPTPTPTPSPTASPTPTPTPCVRNCTSSPTPTPTATPAASPTPTPTPTATAVASPTPTPTPTATPIASPTPTPTATFTPTPTPTATVAPSPTPTATFTPTPTPTATFTPTPTPTATFTPTPTPTATFTPTPTPTATFTPTPTPTATFTPTPTPTATFTPTPTPTATFTPTPTPTATIAISPTPTPTPTPCGRGGCGPSPTPTPTATPVASPTPTPTATFTPTPTPTATIAPSPTPTATFTPTPTPTPVASPTPTPTPTATPVASPTPTPTATFTPTPTPTATIAPSPTPTATFTPTPTPTPIVNLTPTPTPTPTPCGRSGCGPSPTPTPTPILSPTPTPTPTATVAPSPTPTPTATPVVSPTPTPTATFTPTPTPTATPVVSPTPTPTATFTPTPTPTPTPIVNLTPTPTPTPTPIRGH